MALHLIPLTDEPEVHADCRRLAREIGADAVQLSHQLCHNADDLLADPARAARMRDEVAAYRAAGLEVWCWTHEVKRAPASLVEGRRLRFDDPALKEHLLQKYQYFLTEVLPGLTGLVVTFAETDHSVYRDAHISSSFSARERLQQLMQILHQACTTAGIRLAVRDFVYRRDEVSAIGAAIGDLPASVAVMSKCVPHDWHPYYPPNPLLGAYGQREQWVEHDGGLEYEGQNLYPYADLEKLAQRIRGEHAAGVRTWCLRLDRFAAERGASAAATPWGRLFLQVACALARDPQQDLAQLIAAWELEQFRDAALVLHLATESVKRFNYLHRLWLNCHSDLSVLPYAITHLVGGMADRLPDWSGETLDKACSLGVTNFDDAWLARTRAEADAQQHLAEAAWQIFEATPEQGPAAAAWREGLRRLRAWAQLSAVYKEAFAAVRRVQAGYGELASAELAIENFATARRELAWLAEATFLSSHPAGRPNGNAWVWPADWPPPLDDGPWSQVEQSLRLGLTRPPPYKMRW